MLLIILFSEKCKEISNIFYCTFIYKNRCPPTIVLIQISYWYKPTLSSINPIIYEEFTTNKSLHLLVVNCTMLYLFFIIVTSYLINATAIYILLSILKWPFLIWYCISFFTVESIWFIYPLIAIFFSEDKSLYLIQVSKSIYWS